MNRIQWTMLLAAALVPAGCGHESVAGTTQPPAAIVSTASTTADTSPSPEAAAAEPGPATEAPLASSEQTGKPPPKDPSQTRAPADRTPTRPGDAEKITFDDLDLKMAADMVYRPFLLTERVKELEGKRIRISGFISAGAESTTKIKKFILLKNTECKFGPGGQADHLAEVHLHVGDTTKFQIEAIKVEGTLTVEPFQGTDGNTWSIYRLDDAKIVK